MGVEEGREERRRRKPRNKENKMKTKKKKKKKMTHDEVDPTPDDISSLKHRSPRSTRSVVVKGLAVVAMIAVRQCLPAWMFVHSVWIGDEACKKVRRWRESRGREKSERQGRGGKGEKGKKGRREDDKYQLQPPYSAPH